MRRLAAILLAAAAAGAFSGAASAHCPVSYEIIGPGGLYWEINLGGNHYDGMLPGGTPNQLGPLTSWTDTRRVAAASGPLVVSQVFTDGTNYAVCPPVTLNLSGPPQCSEDGQDEAAGAVSHPLCIPYFTVVQTVSGVYSCSSTCQPGAFPIPQAYSPPASTPATLSSLSPSSGKAGSSAIALSILGSGFVGGAIVEWNGSSLSTTFINQGLVVALVPSALLAAPGTASVTVSIPGSVSAAMPFTINP